MELEVLKFILDNHGAVVTSDLLFNLGNTSILSDLICNNDKFVTCLFNGTPKVVVRSRVTLCWRKDCAGCRGLHLCKGFFLTGTCQFTYTRRGCIFSHNLHSDYNEKILREFGLETLSRTQLCALVLQSNNSLLPPICYNYNNRNGCQDSCSRLHICEKFLFQDCSCFRTHDFLAPQPSKLLQDRRIPDSLFTSLRSIYANKEALRVADKPNNRENRGERGSDSGPSNGPAVSSSDLLNEFEYDSNAGQLNPGYDTDSSSSGRTGRGHGAQGRRGRSRGGNMGGSREDILSSDMTGASVPKHSFDKRQNQGQKDKTEICMYFIKGHCRHEDRCFKAHDKMPYRWQIKQEGHWTHMAANENIEQAYCDPANSYSSTPPFVYFDTMKSGEQEVRRLSTTNSVLEPNFIHTTDWLWFWEDDHGKWLQYGANTSVHAQAGVTSKQLEELYLNNDKDVVQFKAGSQSYELSFQDMIQTNVKYGTKRIVRRRPQFVSATDVQTKRKQPTKATKATTFPDYWDKAQISPTEHRCIILQPSLGEYKEIHDLFCQTMKGFDILKIERIQNKAAWEAFQLHKEHLTIRNNGKSVAEKKLFHGTDPSYVNTICATNFDWRVCGLNGTVYGEGSYFARDAKYSHSYTGNSDIRFMFVSRVLVGEYTRGYSEYRRPPSKDGGDVNLYDSCVDDVRNPSIFVVFEKQQIYPEYVLQYRTRDRPTLYQQPSLSLMPVTQSSPSSASTSPNTTSSTSSSNTNTNPSTASSLASSKVSSSTSASNYFMSNPSTASSLASSNVSYSTSASNYFMSNPSTASSLASSNVSSSTSASNHFIPNPSTASSLASSNASSSPSSSNILISNSVTKAPAGSSNASATNPTPASSRSTSNSIIQHPLSTSHISSTASMNYPAQTSSTTPRPTSISYNTSVTDTGTFASDSSFRFSAASSQVTGQALAFPPSQPRKKQNNCVIA